MQQSSTSLGDPALAGRDIIENSEFMNDTFAIGIWEEKIAKRVLLVAGFFGKIPVLGAGGVSFSSLEAPFLRSKYYIIFSMVFLTFKVKFLACCLLVKGATQVSND